MSGGGGARRGVKRSVLTLPCRCRREGVGGFFKGMSSKLLQTCLQSAFLFQFYEKLLRVVVYLLRGGKK